MDTRNIIGYVILLAVVVVGVFLAGWLKTKIAS